MKYNRAKVELCSLRLPFARARQGSRLLGPSDQRGTSLRGLRECDVHVSMICVVTLPLRQQHWRIGGCGFRAMVEWQNRDLSNALPSQPSTDAMSMPHWWDSPYLRWLQSWSGFSPPVVYNFQSSLDDPCCLLSERVNESVTNRVIFHPDAQLQCTMETWQIITQTLDHFHAQDHLSLSPLVRRGASPSTFTRVTTWFIFAW